jgi:hypothetical protein
MTVGRLLLFVLTTLCIVPVGVSGQAAPGRISGRVTDGSGAALPGVTVTVKATALATPAAALTDGVGQYLSPALPPGTYSVTFELSGFESRTVPLVQLRAGEVFILDRQLALAAVSETVDVVAPAPREPAPPRPEPPARPRARPVPKEVLASVCGPTQPRSTDPAIARIMGSQNQPGRELFGDADLLLLDAGADAGIQLGQNLVVRRLFRVSDNSVPLKKASFGEGAAGLIQVVEVSAGSATAVVVYACGEFYVGDAVEPFDALPMWTAREVGTPHYDDPGQVMFGDQRRMLAGPNDLMVINRGATHGAERGQRVTIFRRPRGGSGPVVNVADAIIVGVRDEASTIRIERMSDAVMVGDLVALHR